MLENGDRALVAVDAVHPGAPPTDRDAPPTDLAGIAASLLQASIDSLERQRGEAEFQAYLDSWRQRLNVVVFRDQLTSQTY